MLFKLNRVNQVLLDDSHSVATSLTLHKSSRGSTLSSAWLAAWRPALKSSPEATHCSLAVAGTLRNTAWVSNKTSGRYRATVSKTW